MKKIIVLVALAAFALVGIGCDAYYNGQAEIHKVWAENPRVAKVKLVSADGGAIQNLAGVDIEIPLDAGMRPADLKHPGEIIARPIEAVTPLGLGLIVMDGVKSIAKGNTNNYNSSFNDNQGVQGATGAKVGGVSTISSASAEGASAGGSSGNPGLTESNTSSNGGNSLVSGGN